MKSADFYFSKYKTHLIVLLAIITTNLKYVTNFEFENFFFWMLILFPILGLLASSLFAAILYLGVVLFKHFTEQGKGEGFERKTPFTFFLLIVSIINVIVYVVRGDTILDFIV
ncbi:hypothetical protein [Mesoflavibacter zeaxanthinifaciens]|uniref:hypothetical protein n=1 Tax=Mesoflavibacter zeaxanthinifaciens TaxID=393060 RepID=UPI003A8E3B12